MLTNASSNDIDIYKSSDADVSINPGVMIKASQVIVDLEIKQLETATRGCPLGATTSERQTCHVDDDDEDINNNVVLDPGTLDAANRPSVDELDQQVAHFEAPGIWEPLPALRGPKVLQGERGSEQYVAATAGNNNLPNMRATLPKSFASRR